MPTSEASFSCVQDLRSLAVRTFWPMCCLRLLLTHGYFNWHGPNDHDVILLFAINCNENYKTYAEDCAVKSDPVKGELYGNS